MSRQYWISQCAISVMSVLFFVGGLFCGAAGLTLKSCMEEQQEVSDSSYPAALAYFQKCLDLGKNASRDELPVGYFNKVVGNMRESFEDFLEDSGLGEEQLAAIRKEIRELSGEIRHVPRKQKVKSSKSAPKEPSQPNDTARGEAKNISNKPQSKSLDNGNSTQMDLPDGTLHLEFVNNIWPQQLNYFNPVDDQQPANEQQLFVQQQQQEVNATNASINEPMRKCGHHKTANGVEILTLLLCIITLVLCCWIAYKIYCQYQCWARLRCEASNHKTETTPLNQSESNFSARNDEKSGAPTRRGYF